MDGGEEHSGVFSFVLSASNSYFIKSPLSSLKLFLTNISKHHWADASLMYCEAEGALVGGTLFQGSHTAGEDTPKEARLHFHFIVVATSKVKVCIGE